MFQPNYYHFQQDFLERFEHDEFQHFILDRVLETDSTLSLNTKLLTVSLLCVADNGRPMMCKEIQATFTEFNMLLQILESYPHPATYDILHAAYNNKEVNSATILTSREFLLNAEENRIWDAEVRPMRGSLSRLRLKMRTMNIEIASILKTGYTIMKFQKHQYLSN
jgi:hypothetical protein